MTNNNKSATKRKGKTGFIVWASVSGFLVIFLMVLTILANTLLFPIFTTVLGGRKPIFGEELAQIYTSDYNSKAEAVAAGDELNVRIEEEGAVLLLNEGNALPLSKGSKVSVFGKNSVNLVLSGTGSGSSGSSNSVTIFDGLEKGGFEYNPTLRSFYESSASGAGRTQTTLSDSTAASPDLATGETPIASYNSSVMGSLREYSDAAIVVISRVGGESFDLPRTQDMARGGIAGNHYLQLDSNEYDMLDMVTSRFDKVVVVLNMLSSFQMDFIDEYNNTEANKRIDAVLWIGGPGRNGAEAIGALLNGDVNPSGRTVDLYSRDFTLDPTWQNFGDGSQTTSNNSGNTAFTEGGSAASGLNMVMYEEGVYTGYRYYETRDYEERQEDSSSDWYERNVIFPFGYGLSYTTFNQKIISTEGGLTDKNSQVTITVEVENTGAVAGKDVVQLYVSKPYYRGGIEKSFVELVDFAKTDLLAPQGQAKSTQRIIFTVSAYDLASYDYNDANGNDFPGYELEHGDYTFYIAENSHVAGTSYGSSVVSLDDEAGIRFPEDPITGTKVENLYTLDNYDDIQYRLSDVFVDTEEGTVTRKGMSRTDFEGTFPTAPTAEERELKQESLDGYTEHEKLESFEHNNPIIENAEQREPPTEKSSLMLRDLLNENGRVDYDDERWDELIDKLTFNEMRNLVNNGAFLTISIESIGKNLTNDSDGPVGFVNFMPGAVSEIFAGNTTFACEIVIGSTWDKDLAYQMGKIVGECGLYGDESGNNSLPYSGWYAPAVNLHRSPFSGRNFEYYSEDPILSGKMAVGVINGTARKGVYTDLKHFALNDQETNRAGVSTFCTEQAFREIYLKPFEIAVKGNSDLSHTKSAVEDGVTKFIGTTGIMSSFNRVGNKWTGGDYRLMTQILRNEWGFRGLVICDYKTDNSLMNSRQMLYAGNDLILTSTENCTWTNADSSSVQDVQVLRTAAKNILYTVANSNSIQVDIVGYQTEWWITLFIVLDCVIPVGLAVWGYFAVSKFVKKRHVTTETIVDANEPTT